MQLTKTKECTPVRYYYKGKSFVETPENISRRIRKFSEINGELKDPVKTGRMKDAREKASLFCEKTISELKERLVILNRVKTGVFLLIITVTVYYMACSNLILGRM